METLNQIPEYVYAYLQGEVSGQQAEMAKKWIAENNNAEIFRQLDQINKFSGDLKLFGRFSLDEGKKSVYRKIRKNRIIKISTSFQKAAAVLIIPVLLAAAWLVWQNLSLKNEFASLPALQEIKTQPGVKTHFFLPDSSEVWLNAASTLRFPYTFRGSKRAVELEGEAYFKVFKDKTRPFTVKAGPMNVTALGTAFNICSYTGDHFIAATLEEGKIKVAGDQSNGKVFILAPGEQINYYPESREMVSARVNVKDVVAWKEGKLVFNESPFGEVVTRLGRWFNADIRLADTTLAKYRYTATFTNESLFQVLELLKYTAPIDFSSSSRKVSGNNDFSKQEIKIWGKPDAKINMNQIK